MEEEMSASALPKRKRFTVEEFQRMGEAGVVRARCAPGADRRGDHRDDAGRTSPRGSVIRMGRTSSRAGRAGRSGFVIAEVRYN
jgi:hypothetical protein